MDPNEAPPTASAYILTKLHYLRDLMLFIGQNAEAEMLVTSLRTVISQQSDEILALKTQLAGLQASSASATVSRVQELESDLKSMREAFEWWKMSSMATGSGKGGRSEGIQANVG